MAEYIKREALLLRIDCHGTNKFGMLDEDIRAFVKAQPAADVAPVVHGQWGTGRFNLETGNYEEQCTRCRNFSKEYGKPYCPNCGAKMAGEE